MLGTQKMRGQEGSFRRLQQGAGGLGEEVLTPRKPLILGC